ncbi:MAG: hypothetical protein HKO04_06280 [Silicimonas sp.]|nr:hypothetical protein [Silicimonas sp.]
MKESTVQTPPELVFRNAFTSLGRELKQWKDKISGEAKSHGGLLQGRNVDRDFRDLAARGKVELVIRTDESAIGPQFSTVRKIATIAHAPQPRTGR